MAFTHYEAIQFFKNNIRRGQYFGVARNEISDNICIDKFDEWNHFNVPIVVRLKTWAKFLYIILVLDFIQKLFHG